MKLVVVFNIGDGCTYSSEVVVPIEYESEEAFIVDFEAAVLDAVETDEKRWKYTIINYPVDSFYDFSTKKLIPVDIYTLENWFEKFKGFDIKEPYGLGNQHKGKV